MSGKAERLIRRLEHRTTLSPDDRSILESVASTLRTFEPREYLAKQGLPVERLFLIIEGFACRYRLLPDGRRQITAFMLPGDLCDLGMFALSYMDHSVTALSAVEAAVLTADVVPQLRARPVLVELLAWNALVQQSIAREWLVNVGHRTSFERLGHLLCETYERLQMVGLAREGVFRLPLTQSEIADTLALSPVHVNRTLMELRRSGLVTFQSRQIVIHDYPGLCTAAGFDRGYLHLDRPGAAAA
jgi:CRP-like cAMP-binding protein